MIISKGICFTKDQLFDLYRNVNWTAYLENEEALWSSIIKSLDHYTVFNDKAITGYLRLLGDGINTVVIQDLIIRSENQGQGLGSIMLKNMLEDYKLARQIILLCDNEEEINHFYKSNGFRNIEEYGIKCFGIIR